MMTGLFITSIILYAFPLRYLLIAWVVYKFSKNLLKPKHVDNIKILDFLSRVPDDQQLASLFIRYYTIASSL